MKVIPEKIIDSCSDCTEHKADSRCYLQYTQANYTIPSWCPLKDYKGWHVPREKCHGRPEIKEASEPCPECLGKKQIWVRDPSFTDITHLTPEICPLCKGTGKKE